MGQVRARGEGAADLLQGGMTPQETGQVRPSGSTRSRDKDDETTVSTVVDFGSAGRCGGSCVGA